MRSTDIERYAARTTPAALETLARYGEGYIKAMLKPLYAPRESLLGEDLAVRDALEGLSSGHLPILVNNSLSPLCVKFPGMVKAESAEGKELPLPSKYQTLIAFSRICKSYQLFRIIGEELLGGVAPAVYGGNAFFYGNITHTDMEGQTDSGLSTDMMSNAFPVIRYDIPYASDERVREFLGEDIPYWSDLNAKLKELSDFLVLVIPARAMVVLNTVPCFFYGSGDRAYFRFRVSSDAHLELLTESGFIPPDFNLDTEAVPDEIHLMNDNVDPELDVHIEGGTAYLHDEEGVLGLQQSASFANAYYASGMQVLEPEDEGDPEWRGNLLYSFPEYVVWDVGNITSDDANAVVSLEQKEGYVIIFVSSYTKFQWLKIESLVPSVEGDQLRWTQFCFDWDKLPRFMEAVPLYCLKIYVYVGMEAEDE